MPARPSGLYALMSKKCRAEHIYNRRWKLRFAPLPPPPPGLEDAWLCPLRFLYTKIYHRTEKCGNHCKWLFNLARLFSLHYSVEQGYSAYFDIRDRSRPLKIQRQRGGGEFKHDFQGRNWYWRSKFGLWGRLFIMIFGFKILGVNFGLSEFRYSA